MFCVVCQRCLSVLCPARGGAARCGACYNPSRTCCTCGSRVEVVVVVATLLVVAAAATVGSIGLAVPPDADMLLPIAIPRHNVSYVHRTLYDMPD